MAFLTLLVFVFLGSLFTTGVVFMIPVWYIVNDRQLSKVWYLLSIPCWIVGMLLYVFLMPLYIILVIPMWFYGMIKAPLETCIAFIIGVLLIIIF